MMTKLGKNAGVTLTDEQWVEAQQVGNGNESEGVRRLLEQRVIAIGALDRCSARLEIVRQERDEAQQSTLNQPARWLGYGFLACALLYSAALWVLSLFY